MELEIISAIDKFLAPMGYMGRILAAAALGAAVGIEREYKGKAAGVKTNMLICVGSCLAMIVSIELGGKNWDPARIAAQVVSGIGFLGAGTIIQSKHFIKGLTTAATLWLLASVGLAAGSGFYAVAAGATITVLLILTVLGKAESFILKIGHRTLVVVIELDATSRSIGEIDLLLSDLKLKEHGFKIEKWENRVKFSFAYSGRASQIKSFQEKLFALPDARRLDIEIEG